MTTAHSAWQAWPRHSGRTDDQEQCTAQRCLCPHLAHRAHCLQPTAHVSHGLILDHSGIAIADERRTHSRRRRLLLGALRGRRRAEAHLLGSRARLIRDGCWQRSQRLMRVGSAAAAAAAAIASGLLRQRGDVGPRAAADWRSASVVARAFRAAHVHDGNMREQRRWNNICLQIYCTYLASTPNSDADAHAQENQATGFHSSSRPVEETSQYQIKAVLNQSPILSLDA